MFYEYDRKDKKVDDDRIGGVLDVSANGDIGTGKIKRVQIYQQEGHDLHGRTGEKIY